MLQTNYRFAGPIGYGELLTAAFLFLSLASRLLSSGRMTLNQPDKLTLQFVSIVFFIITPITCLAAISNTAGMSFRDLVAYYFVCAVLLFLPKSKMDVRWLIGSFLFFTLLTVGLQYIFGGDASYYSIRFTGGAKNPNQLGLYLVVAMIFAAFLDHGMAKLLVAAVCMFFGIAALSDAFLVFAIVTMLVLTSLILLPPRTVLFLLPVFFMGLYFTFLSTGVQSLLIELWTFADEGGARITLYLSAIQAWLVSPISAILGNGAGSFSGLRGPFGGVEAHNTALDFATVAGIFGLYLFPIFPVLMVLDSLSKGFRLLPAVLTGLIAFCLFHFVGRQPIYWVAIVLVYRFLGETSDKESLSTDAAKLRVEGKA